jgi:4-hydroxybenzoate polyprenyltransferase
MSLIPVAIFALGMMQSYGAWSYVWHDWLKLVAAGLISLATFSYNDYRDRSIDFQKGKVFAKEHPHFALSVAIFCFAAGVLIAYLIGLKFGLLLTGFAVGSIFYCVVSVNVIWLKNFSASFLSAILIPAGGVAAGAVTLNQWLFFAIVFFIVLAQELIKDAEDVEIDKDSRVTLAQALPMSKIKLLVFICITASSFLTFFIHGQAAMFFVLYLLALIFFWCGHFFLPKKAGRQNAHASIMFFNFGLWCGMASLLFVK